MSIKLIPEAKTAWLTALRDGSHAQAQRQLRTLDGFCCLGVVCDILPLGEWMGHAYFANDELGDGSSASAYTIPIALRSKVFELDAPANIDQSNELNKILNRLITMNDNGRSFSEIADWIEENL